MCVLILLFLVYLYELMCVLIFFFSSLFMCRKPVQSVYVLELAKLMYLQVDLLAVCIIGLLALGLALFICYL